MTELTGELSERRAAGPLCDLGPLILSAVENYDLSPDGNVRYVEADVPDHPLLVAGSADHAGALIDSAIACIASRPGINRRIVVGARLDLDRVQLRVGHGNGAGGHASVPVSLDELQPWGPAQARALFAQERTRMLRLLDALDATLVIGVDVTLDAAVLSIVFPAIGSRPRRRPYTVAVKTGQANR
ncbi:hypothetical protein [Pigmentiphaga sp. D-2]|jgi:hypothetical protein|uniref:hypothetical protein n=1 Tax=Pigmentiphaga sp. D-2 TaxID=1002116 RepID=UPI001047563E|nr:hypothetical protein [Pigmentiphaga sp. D-2]